MRDALAEALSLHQYGPPQRTWTVSQNYQQCCCDGETRTMVDELDHVAAALVAAVRRMTPDQQAELIGGSVDDKWIDCDPMDYHHRRAVGAWGEPIYLPPPSQQTPPWASSGASDD